MITRIGVIYQDRNSLGFLRGLQARLECNADLIEPPAAIGTTRHLPRKHTKWAWSYFQKKGVDLVIRFTDADGARWQEVRRSELSRVPSEAQSIWICGVAVDNPEDWLALDLDYLAPILQRSRAELQDVQNRAGVIKRAILELACAMEGYHDVVERIVRETPTSVFHRWLNDSALRAFYTDCRSAAAAADCPTPNELEREPDA